VPRRKEQRNGNRRTRPRTRRTPQDDATDPGAPRRPTPTNPPPPGKRSNTGRRPARNALYRRREERAGLGASGRPAR
jgi:hypothetical protein